MSMISEGMRGAQIGCKEERAKRTSSLANYIIDTMHLHNGYATGYFICEALNFINVVSTFKLINLVNHIIGKRKIKHGSM